MKSKFSTASAVFALFFGLLVFSGCSKPPVTGVTFNTWPNLETVRVAMNFADYVPSTFGGSYKIGNYGSVFAQPSSFDQPFQIGFDVNTGIFNDNEYVNVSPKVTLPAGYPIPNVKDRAFAVVQTPQLQNSPVDVFAYVDVYGKEWVGVAVLGNTLSRNFAIPGFHFFSKFLDGKAFGDVSGPSTVNGKLVAPYISFFVNVAALLNKQSTPKNVGFDRGHILYYRY